MLVHYLENLYLYLGSKVILGSFRVRGFKEPFSQKMLSFFMSHSMVMKLKYVYQLKIL